MPAPKQSSAAALKAPNLSLVTPHEYSFQKVTSHDGRFTYDGRLPSINSKYRKMSFDLNLQAQTPHKIDDFLTAPITGNQYDLKTTLVQDRVKGFTFNQPRISDSRAISKHKTER